MLNFKSTKTQNQGRIRMKKRMHLFHFLLITTTIIVTNKVNASEFSFNSLQSTARGIRIEAIMTYQENAYDIKILKHDKEAGFVRKKTDWVVIKNSTKAARTIGRYYFYDRQVERGNEYCYRLKLKRKIHRNKGLKTTGTKCVFFDGDTTVNRPLGPINLKIIKNKPNALRLEFKDRANNEEYFFLEKEELSIQNGETHDRSWNVVGINQTSSGNSGKVTMDINSLEMERRYCFRVRAVNNAGKALSNHVCGKTSSIELKPFKSQDNSTIVPKTLTHPSLNTLKVTWFDTFRDHTARVITLFEIDDLDNVAKAKLYNLNVNTPVPSTQSVVFDDLDPAKEYCVNVKELVFPFMPPQSICESAFGAPSKSSDRAPIIPTIRKITKSPNRLKIYFSNPMEGQLLDMTQSDNGFRTTLISARDGRDSITLSLQGSVEYCFRVFRTNIVGTRYGKSHCAVVPRQPSGDNNNPDTDTGPTGGGGVPPTLQEQVDCDCQLTGGFVNVSAPPSGTASEDGVYRVTKTTNSIAIFRNSDNQRVFNETALNNGFSYGFGPRSKYIFLAVPQGQDRVSVGVHDLESGIRIFFDSNVIGSNGWGFSPDGRTFMLVRKSIVSPLIVNLVNLDTQQSENLFFSSSSSSFYQFSQCGDVFVIVSQTDESGSDRFLNLYSTASLEEITHRFSINSNYTNIETTSTNHIVQLSSGSPQIITDNSAQQSCQIPIRAGGIYDLQVVRFPQATVNSQSVSSLFSEVSTLLQTDSGDNDVACDVTFNRVGNIISYSTGDGSIDSATELSEALNSPGQVKVVNQINYCSGDMKPGILGCANTPGRSFIFVRGQGEHVTVAHEFGHNRGLNHNENDITSLMYPSAEPESLNINQQACNVLLGLSAKTKARFTKPVAKVLENTTNVFKSPAKTKQPSNSIISVEKFVRRIYFEGIPYGQAIKYGRSDITQLIRMLHNPREKRYWSNIVVTLGMTGSKHAIRPLVAFINDSSHNLTQEIYNAKTSAIMSLGYILNATKDPSVLKYLTQSLTPSIWEARKIQGTAKYQSSVSERNMDFSKYAVLALALSGTREANDALKVLQSPNASKRNPKFTIQYAELINDALNENKKISVKGLHNYYLRK